MAGEQAKQMHIEATYHSATARMVNANGNPFWVQVSQGGLKVFDRMNDAGRLLGNPIEVSAQDLFDWVGKMPGASGTKFEDRAAFKRR